MHGDFAADGDVGWVDLRVRHDGGSGGVFVDFCVAWWGALGEFVRVGFQFFLQNTSFYYKKIKSDIFYGFSNLPVFVLCFFVIFFFTRTLLFFVFCSWAWCPHFPCFFPLFPPCRADRQWLFSFRTEHPRGRSATHRSMMVLESRRGNHRCRPSRFQSAVFGNTSVPRRSSKHRSTFFSCWTKQVCGILANFQGAGLADTARSLPDATPILPQTKSS